LDPAAMGGDKDGKGLTDEERRLWSQVVREARPIKKGARTTPAERSATSPPSAEKTPATQAKSPRKAAAQKRPEKPATPPAPELRHGSAAGMDRRQADRFKRGKMAIEGRLDLHGMTRQGAHGALRRFLLGAAAADKRCVLVITGKGRASPQGGVLCEEVPRWLNEPGLRDTVLSFTYARPPDGGEGALYVLLKRRRPEKGARPGSS
jgi:DNA-nicking Smr family endonuclease